MKFPLYRGSRLGPRLLGALLLISPAVLAQSEATSAAPGTETEIVGKIDQLTKSLEQTQVELAQSRTEIQQLRSTLQELLTRMNALSQASPNAQDRAAAETVPPPQQPSEESHSGAAQISQDDWDVLNARVDEQRQTKVESASRYRLKLSGIALFNAFGNFGQVDN